MKAVKLVTVGAPLEVQDVAAPEPNDTEVLVRVAGCGVCHTDIGFWKDGVPTKQALPLTLGHEISGTVVGADRTSSDTMWRVRVVLRRARECMPRSIDAR
jgi:6-hydroxycyclohex-1-ene-1-carbonyl-CoA dehydrogenase